MFSCLPRLCATRLFLGKAAWRADTRKRPGTANEARVAPFGRLSAQPRPGQRARGGAPRPGKLRGRLPRSPRPPRGGVAPPPSPGPGSRRGEERVGAGPGRAEPCLLRRCWACGCGSWRAACCCSAAAARQGAPPPPPSAPTRCPPCGVSEGPGAAGWGTAGWGGAASAGVPRGVCVQGGTRGYFASPHTPVLSRGAEEAPGPRRALLGAAAAGQRPSTRPAVLAPGPGGRAEGVSSPPGHSGCSPYAIEAVLAAGFWGGGKGNGR